MEAYSQYSKFGKYEPEPSGQVQPTLINATPFNW